MAQSSGGGFKIALRLILFICLGLGGLSLYYSKEIGIAYEEWKNSGRNEERVTLPVADNSTENKATQSSGQSPNMGSTLWGDDFFGTTHNGTAVDQFYMPDSDDTQALHNASANQSAEQTDSQNEGQAGQLEGGSTVTTETGQQAQVGGVALPQHGDTVVSPVFIRDLATFLVSSYYPAGTNPNPSENRAYLSTTLRTINMHYGSESGRYFKKGRLETLHYVMAPSMMEALYRLYVDDFIKAMQYAAKTEERQLRGGVRVLTDAEQRQMFLYFSNLAAGMSGVFEACAASPAIAEKLDNYYLAAINTADKNKILIDISIAREQEQAVSGVTEQTGAAYKNATAAYNKSIQEREAAKDELMLALKRYPKVRNLDDADALYAAAWINRRFADGSADVDAIAAAARVFSNLSGRFKAAGGQ